MPGRREEDSRRITMATWGAPLAVSGVIILLTLVLWRVDVVRNTSLAQFRFDIIVQEIVADLKRRVASYDALLDSANAMLSHSHTVHQHEWRLFVEAVELDDHFPAALGLGYVEQVSAADRIDFEEGMRTEGPDFTIDPPGERDSYQVLVLMEGPHTDRLPRPGRDVGLVPERMEAFYTARDTGKAAFTRTLPRHDGKGEDTDTGPGIGLVHPVYHLGEPIGSVAERRAALRGWVVAPLVAETLFEGLVSPVFDVDLDIYAAPVEDEDRLIYDTSPENLERARARTVQFITPETVRIGGQTWLVTVSSTASFEAAHRGRTSDYILVAGLLIALALGVATRSLMSSRSEALKLAEAMTGDLKRSNADLQQFAYVASHDLREPLRNVSSYLQLLERQYGDRLDETGHEFIGFAVEGAKRMDALIRDLLRYSRIETLGEAFTRVDSEAVVQEALDNLKTTIEDASGIITYSDLPTVVADPSQLLQLFQNLIGNALKYHHADRPPEIRIQANSSETGTTFSLTDNGIGLEAEYAERIFIIFQRLHGRDEYEGTGIGLAVCKRIVERHGGRIWVESEPGMGSTFYFTLPSAK